MLIILRCFHVFALAAPPPISFEEATRGKDVNLLKSRLTAPRTLGAIIFTPLHLAIWLRYITAFQRHIGINCLILIVKITMPKAE